MRHLPPDAAVNRATDNWWSEPLELQAVLLELVHALLRVTLAANGGKEIPEPLTVPRPYEAHSAADEELTLDDWQRFFEG